VREIDSSPAQGDNPVPHLELSLAPTAEDLPEMAIALIQKEGSSRFEAMAQIAESWS
jgi:hypothetical protein